MDPALIGDTYFFGVVKDIKTLKIQGAENVARRGVEAFKFYKDEHYDASMLVADFVKGLIQAKKTLVESRPTEPALRNALHIIFDERAVKNMGMNELNSLLDRRIALVESHFKTVISDIPRIGSQKIKNNFKVFTHCHSSTVTSILVDARLQGKNFEVHNTETRPVYQGRITARELAAKKIKVVHYVDSAMRIAIKQCNIVLIGCDAIDVDGKIYNKIGSELVCEVARQYGVPVYVCTDSWKYDAGSGSRPVIIEERGAAEIWEDAPSGVIVKNYAFERIHPRLVTGIICEFGIIHPADFLAEVKKRYPQLK